MKKIILLPVIIMALPLMIHAQWPSSVTTVQSKANDSVTVSGDLAKGAIMEDISWAASSSNACFPATQNLKFMGNHVFYATTIPPRSILTVSVTPADETGNLSLYGYMMGNNEFRVVPNLPSCITCEADHKWDRPWKGKVQTSERKIEFQNPTSNTYNILVGVTAPKDVITGQFALKIKLKS
jgi:hypothetical protein